MTRFLPAAAAVDASLVALLELEPLERDLFRAATVFDDPFPLYGGQVAAQALVAAGLGRTIRAGRVPHSLHGYFLRGGDAGRPTVFRVDRDRDGRSFSARRVVAVQDGEVVFSMSASFQDPEDGLDLSDIMSGLAPLATAGYRPGTSLDHAVWFHRPARLDDWVLVDLVGRTAGGGRGWYTGTVGSRDGVLRASIAQESLFRRQRRAAPGRLSRTSTPGPPRVG